ncbi:MAG: hypothetical protein M5R40_29705 [Anaerolineae bacterium]|nr:hypothetical protein [Anaerolineae bacterium]
MGVKGLVAGKAVSEQEERLRGAVPDADDERPLHAADKASAFALVQPQHQFLTGDGVQHIAVRLNLAPQRGCVVQLTGEEHDQVALCIAGGLNMGVEDANANAAQGGLGCEIDIHLVPGAVRHRRRHH